MAVHREKLHERITHTAKLIDSLKLGRTGDAVKRHISAISRKKELANRLKYEIMGTMHLHGIDVTKVAEPKLSLDEHVDWLTEAEWGKEVEPKGEHEWKEKAVEIEIRGEHEWKEKAVEVRKMLSAMGFGAKEGSKRLAEIGKLAYEGHLVLGTPRVPVPARMTIAREEVPQEPKRRGRKPGPPKPKPKKEKKIEWTLEHVLHDALGRIRGDDQKNLARFLYRRVKENPDVKIKIKNTGTHGEILARLTKQVWWGPNTVRSMKSLAKKTKLSEVTLNSINREYMNAIGIQPKKGRRSASEFKWLKDYYFEFEKRLHVDALGKLVKHGLADRIRRHVGLHITEPEEDFFKKSELRDYLNSRAMPALLYTHAKEEYPGYVFNDKNYSDVLKKAEAITTALKKEVVDNPGVRFFPDIGALQTLAKQHGYSVPKTREDQVAEYESVYDNLPSREDFPFIEGIILAREKARKPEKQEILVPFIGPGLKTVEGPPEEGGSQSEITTAHVKALRELVMPHLKTPEQRNLATFLLGEVHTGLNRKKKSFRSMFPHFKRIHGKDLRFHAAAFTNLIERIATGKAFGEGVRLHEDLAKTFRISFPILSQRTVALHRKYREVMNEKDHDSLMLLFKTHREKVLRNTVDQIGHEDLEELEQAREHALKRHAYELGQEDEEWLRKQKIRKIISDKNGAKALAEITAKGLLKKHIETLERERQEFLAMGKLEEAESISEEMSRLSDDDLIPSFETLHDTITNNAQMQEKIYKSGGLSLNTKVRIAAKLMFTKEELENEHFGDFVAHHLGNIAPQVMHSEIQETNTLMDNSELKIRPSVAKLLAKRLDFDSEETIESQAETILRSEEAKKLLRGYGDLEWLRGDALTALDEMAEKGDDLKELLENSSKERDYTSNQNYAMSCTHYDFEQGLDLYRHVGGVIEKKVAKTEEEAKEALVEAAEMLTERIISAAIRNKEHPPEIPPAILGKLDKRFLDKHFPKAFNESRFEWILTRLFMKYPNRSPYSIAKAAKQAIKKAIKFGGISENRINDLTAKEVKRRGGKPEDEKGVKEDRAPYLFDKKMKGRRKQRRKKGGGTW